MTKVADHSKISEAGAKVISDFLLSEAHQISWETIVERVTDRIGEEIMKGNWPLVRNYVQVAKDVGWIQRTSNLRVEIYEKQKLGWDFKRLHEHNTAAQKLRN